MSEQKWTLHKVSHSGNVTIVSPDGTWITYAWVPPEEDGVPSKVWNGLRRLVQCASACEGIPDPAAEIARLRWYEAQYDMIRNAAKKVLDDNYGDNGDALDAMANLESAVYSTDVKAKEAVSELERLRDVEAEVIKLRTVYAAAVEECKEWRKSVGDRDPAWFAKDTNQSIVQADTHDAARAEAGMEEIK